MIQRANAFLPIESLPFPLHKGSHIQSVVKVFLDVFKSHHVALIERKDEDEASSIFDLILYPKEVGKGLAEDISLEKL